MTRMGIVADDLTGATTAAALLADAGVDNLVVLTRADGDAVGPDHDAVIVSTDSRALPPEEASSRVRRATERLRARGATLFSKRTDTTMRGGIGYEIAGMMSALDDDRVAIVVPAMPQSRRIVVGGYSLIDSVLLGRTQVARDIRTPVHESHVPTLLRSQMDTDVDHVSLSCLLEGEASMRRHLAEKRAEGCRVFVVDATSTQDVDLIARVVTDLKWSVVCVDPGPFSRAYALANGVPVYPRAEKARLRREALPTDHGTVVVVAGSATTITTTQLANLVVEPGSCALNVDVAALIRGGSACQEEYDSVLAELDRNWTGESQPRVVVIALDSSLTGNLVDMDAIEDDAGIPRGAGVSQLADRLGRLARQVMERIGDRLAGVYLTGGDVMVSTCRAMSADGISLSGYVIPQSDHGVLVGGPCDGVPVVGKGGLTGDRLTAIHIVNRLFDERKIS